MSSLQDSLIKWFELNRRDLPWRSQRSPYRTWISEMMLQQTQVSTMLPYFERWMKAFPTVQALHAAELDDVLHLWQGLGYYSRARNIKKAASAFLERHQGEVPHTYEELIQIPGIGPYSAGAILSLAFNKKAPIVDGNVSRVLARVFGIHDPIDESATRQKIYQLQSELVPENKPGVFNEALMELGALVCTPKQPKCLTCPLQKFCYAFKHSETDVLPKKKNKIKITQVYACAVILKMKDHVFLHRRPEGEIMGGLWEFPEWKLGQEEQTDSQQKQFLSEELNLPLKVLIPVGKIKRSYTRFQERMSVFEVEVKALPRSLTRGWEEAWVAPDQLKDYPLTSAHAKIRALVLQSC